MEADGWAITLFLHRWLAYAVGLSAAGAALFLPLFGRRLSDAERHRITRLGAIAGLLWLLLALIDLPLRAAHLATSLAGLVDGDLLRMLATTPVGAANAFAIAAGGLLLTPVFAANAGRWLAPLGALCVVAALATAGHAAVNDGYLGRMLVGVHLIAAAFWIGALWPLRQLVRAGSPSSPNLLQRFGRLAMPVVAALVLAGAVLAWRLLGALDMLWDSRYGALLLAKLACVVALLALAALNRLSLVPRLAAGDADAARGLSRSILAEWLLALAILLLTATMTSFASPFRGA